MRSVQMTWDESKLAAIGLQWSDINEVMIAPEEWNEFHAAVTEAHAMLEGRTPTTPIAVETLRPTAVAGVRIGASGRKYHRTAHIGSRERQMLQLLANGPARAAYLQQHTVVTRTGKRIIRAQGSPISINNIHAALQNLQRKGLVNTLDGSYWLTQRGIDASRQRS